MIDRPEPSSDRAQSVALNYVLVLGISAILISGLVVAGGSFVEDQRETVIEGELNVIGTHIAGNLEQADRYVNGTETDPTTAHINQTFQREVTGEGYRIDLVPNDGNPQPPQLVLSPQTADTTVRVNASVDSSFVGESTARGGTVTVYYNGSHLVIGNE